MKISKMIGIATMAFLAVAALAQEPSQGGPGGGFGGPGGQGGPPPFMMGGPGGGTGLAPTSQLLQRKDVQAELKLTDEQIKQIQALRPQGRGFGGPGGGGPGGGGFGGPGGGEGPGGPPPGEGEGGFQGGPPPGGGEQGDGPPDFETMRKQMEAQRKKTEEKINAILTADQKTRVRQIAIQLAGSSAIADATVQKDLTMTDAQVSKVKSLVKSQGEANRAIFEKMRNGEIERDEIQTLMQKNTKILKDELGKVLTADQQKKLADLGGAKFTATDPERGPRFGGPGGGGR